MTARLPSFPLQSAGVLVTLLLAAGLSACSESAGGGDEPAPETVLEAAKQELADTSGVELALTTESLPSGVEGLIDATGTLTDAPAFDGVIKAQFNNITADVPVVSVGGVVYAKLPFTNKFAEVNPADYGAPDPALLMDSRAGITSWLTEATEVERGEQTRQGDVVVTEFSGTLAGEVVARTIPSAEESADFPVTFAVDDDDRLQSIDISGPFYDDSGDVDYTVTVRDYDVRADIKRP